MNLPTSILNVRTTIKYINVHFVTKFLSLHIKENVCHNSNKHLVSDKNTRKYKEKPHFHIRNFCCTFLCCSHFLIRLINIRNESINGISIGVNH